MYWVVAITKSEVDGLYANSTALPSQMTYLSTFVVIKLVYVLAANAFNFGPGVWQYSLYISRFKHFMKIERHVKGLSGKTDEPKHNFGVQFH